MAVAVPAAGVRGRCGLVDYVPGDEVSLETPQEAISPPQRWQGVAKAVSNITSSADKHANLSGRSWQDMLHLSEEEAKEEQRVLGLLQRITSEMKSNGTFDDEDDVDLDAFETTLAGLTATASSLGIPDAPTTTPPLTMPSPAPPPASSLAPSHSNSILTTELPQVRLRIPGRVADCLAERAVACLLPAESDAVSSCEDEPRTGDGWGVPRRRFEEEMISLAARGCNLDAQPAARESIHSLSAMLHGEHVSSAATPSESDVSVDDSGLPLEVTSLLLELRDEERTMRAIRKNAATTSQAGALAPGSLPSYYPGSSVQVLRPPLQRVHPNACADGTAPEGALEHCAACLDVIARASGFTGVDSFRTLCEHTTSLKQSPASLTHEALTSHESDVAHVIEFVTDNNWLLWILKEHVLRIQSIKGLSDVSLSSALSISGSIHQLLLEVLRMAHMITAHKKFLQLLRETDEYIHEQLETIVGIFAGVLQRPCKEVADEYQKVVVDIKQSVEKLVDVLMSLPQVKSAATARRSHALIDAYDAAVNGLIEQIERASSVLSNRFTAVMEKQHAQQIKALRTGAIPMPFNALPAAYDRMRHAYGGVAVPLELRLRSSADGVLLCLAARHILKELPPQHNAAWRSSDTTGAVIDFILSGATDVRSLFTPPTFETLSDA